jgi:hypothetical protein
MKAQNAVEPHALGQLLGGYFSGYVVDHPVVSALPPGLKPVFAGFDSRNLRKPGTRDRTAWWLTGQNDHSRGPFEPKAVREAC